MDTPLPSLRCTPTLTLVDHELLQILRFEILPFTRCHVTHDDITKSQKIKCTKYNYVTAAMCVLILIEIKVCLIGKMAHKKLLDKV